MKNTRRLFCFGLSFLMLFFLWTVLVQTVDVKPLGVNGTDIGFANLNIRFFELTGVSMTLYNITDWLGLVPVVVGMVFAILGLWELIRRKSLFKVDTDILILGVCYVAVLAGYILFEMYPVNYRPVLINGYLEASYPSSTTLLVLGVMPTLWEQANRRVKNKGLRCTVKIFTAFFSVFMVAGRLLSGVHWLTDILGSVFLCAGLFCLYKGAMLCGLKKIDRRGLVGIR